MMNEMLAIEGDFEGFRANAAFLEQNCCDVSKYWIKCSHSELCCFLQAETWQ